MSDIQRKDITVNQHYVPRFYMKNFSELKEENTDKEKVLISFYQFEKQLFKELVPTKSICYKEYFYGEDGRIENDFKLKESKWAEIIKKLISVDGTEIVNEEKESIKQFAIFQYCRTLATYNYNNKMLNAMIEVGLNNRGDYTTEKDRKMIEVEDLINLCDDIINLTDDLEVSIVKNTTENKFITSDMPIIVMNPFLRDITGFTSAGIMIMFPISPKVMVIIYDSKMYKNNAYIVINEKKYIDNINYYQVISAEERIMSLMQEELKAFVNNQDLLLKRNDFMNNKKIEVTTKGAEMVIGAKARCMPYYFKLPFCKMPQFVSKIPFDCRESVSREYDRRERIKLLVCEYKIPTLLNKDINISLQQVNKMKDGYSRMRKFMEDYWGLSNDERNISPELMHKLKTVPIDLGKIKEI